MFSNGISVPMSKVFILDYRIKYVVVGQFRVGMTTVAMTFVTSSSLAAPMSIDPDLKQKQTLLLPNALHRIWPIGIFYIKKSLHGCYSVT